MVKKKKTTKKKTDYGAGDIYVLEGLDPVRKRPAMYIGSTGSDGLHHLIWETADNSLSFNTPVFVKERGRTKIKKIGELIDKAFENNTYFVEKAKKGEAEILRKNIDIQTLSFDPKTLKLKFRPAFSLIRHKVNSPLYRLTLQNNRRIEITPYHSLFSLKEGEVVPIKGKEIKKGTPIVVPKKWPEVKDKDYKIDLIEELLNLSKEKTENINLHNIKNLLTLDARKELAPVLREKANKTSSQHYTNLFYDYGRYDYLPFNFLRILGRESIEKAKKSCLISSRGNKRVSLKPFLKVNKELVELLGLFAAEGCLVKNEGVFNRVSFGLGSHEKRLIAYLCQIIEKSLGISLTPHYVHETARTVTIDSYLIALIFKEIFKAGKSSAYKRIPGFIFDLNRNLRERYLISYLAGDGYPNKTFINCLVRNILLSDKERRKFAMTSKSRYLITDFSYLLSTLGKTYSFGKRKGKKRSIGLNYKGNKRIQEIKKGSFFYSLDFYWNNHSSYINYIPADQIISYINYKRPYSFSVNLRGGISCEKALGLLEKERIGLKGNAFKFLNSDLGILKVKKIEKIRYNHSWVYDISVPNGENFVAGFSPILAHNSLDEALAGYAKNIKIALLPDNRVRTEDDGRGIPVDRHSKTKKSALETVMTTLHAGGKFGGKAYQVAGGLHGVGVSVVCALSNFLRAEVCREGKKYSQEYAKGKAKTKLKKEGSCKGTGTTVTFEPDPEIFSETNFSSKRILSHLRQQAYLTSGVRITFEDKREKKDKSYTFYFEGGIASYIKYLTHGVKPLHSNIFYASGEKEDILVEASFRYTEEYETYEESFANNIFTPEGGTHLTGFRSALTRGLNDYARKNDLLKESDENLSGQDVREGLTGVVSVKIREPQFEGQTKAKLGNIEAKSAVDQVVSEALTDFFERNPRDAKTIIEKCILSSRARKAAKNAKETVLRKGALEGLALPGKLADCTSKKPEESELFVVEGDSAGGCFSGETKVALLDGRNVSFKQLVKENHKGKKNYCYTIKENGIVGTGLIEHPRKTKINTDVIKVVLDNGEEITCTPDHKFMLRDKSYKKAEDLTVEDSLMPLYKKYSKKGGRITIEGYEMVFDAKREKWIFTHLLADEYNLKNNVYKKSDGYDKHHIDFNKLNNNPDNIVRMKKDDHWAYHRKMLQYGLHSEKSKEKSRKVRATKEYREKIRKIMTTPKMRKMLSERAKRQWEDEEYKKYMVKKFKEFYHSNPDYRKKNNELLYRSQKEYWANEENRKGQSNRVKKFFENHPQVKENLSLKVKKEWQSEELLEWRREKTKKQWTSEFRAKRKKAYDRTYLDRSLAVMNNIYKVNGELDRELYKKERIERKDKCVLKYETICNRFFNNNEKKMKEVVSNYNHKIKKVVRKRKKMDVYDLEVKDTHNFALASGVFVHNSCKSARDRRFQAILPLRGKILNVEKARIDRILSSKEIKALIIALGTAIGEEFDIERARYHRIILTLDADVDGAHIRTLLLTLFYRYFKPIIEKGYLYIAQPPLYKIQAGKKKEYAYTEEGKKKLIEKLKKESKNIKFSIQRYKGLGEMNPSQLWETTMNPENRILLQVTIEDAKAADKIFDTLMGGEVAPRKKFIQTYAKKVENLDI